LQDENLDEELQKGGVLGEGGIGLGGEQGVGGAKGLPQEQEQK